MELKNTEISPQNTIALMGNPNVGKSTVFNALTGMKQHTGNWAGKTVETAIGYFKNNSTTYKMVDLPGTYSLFTHSAEESVARDFLCFEDIDKTVVVCSAGCLERSLILALQCMEIKNNVIICVNLLDEAENLGLKIDLEKLSEILGVKVVGTVARNKKSLSGLIESLNCKENKTDFKIEYPEIIENAIEIIEKSLENFDFNINKRFLSLRILEQNRSFLKNVKLSNGRAIMEIPEINSALLEAWDFLKKEGLYENRISDFIASAVVKKAEKTAGEVISETKSRYSKRTELADKILTHKFLGFFVMLLGLCLVFWITIYGANYLSNGLSFLFSYIEKLLESFLNFLKLPNLIKDIIIDGAFRVTSWVISVMLPPMAIFFPLFTFLEDIGYLPRIAYNLDEPFNRCRSCGKQALTMCMGFGCNAAGVTGCRIIDSKRDRILAIVTNSLVPCNGRFPAIIAIISMFIVTLGGFFGSLLEALVLTLVIMLGVFFTLISTKILSSTLFKGTPSAFTLEMPPYRKPQILKILVRSLLDRTAFVLGRAVTVAIPAGIIIWLFANIKIENLSLLAHISAFLDPFATLLGLDGVILLAFILGLPANEIVIPIIIMGYLSASSLTDLPSLNIMKDIFIQNGWTIKTAINFIIFCLFHWPCSTTLMTIKKETGSLRLACLSALLPTLIGILLCFLINLIF
ncbi:MAG: ferrous iron transport protein B [Clostridia bacterium]|nr:ferrous iron transport protein B [Clostridia bacterium]